MNFANTILLICGIIVLFFGVVAFINPNMARWINAPGGPRLKAIISMIVGIILIIISLVIDIPME